MYWNERKHWTNPDRAKCKAEMIQQPQCEFTIGISIHKTAWSEVLEHWKCSLCRLNITQRFISNQIACLIKEISEISSVCMHRRVEDLVNVELSYHYRGVMHESIVSTVISKKHHFSFIQCNECFHLLFRHSSIHVRFACRVCSNSKKGTEYRLERRIPSLGRRNNLKLNLVFCLLTVNHRFNFPRAKYCMAYKNAKQTTHSNTTT